MEILIKGSRTDN